MFDWLFGKIEMPFNQRDRFSEVNDRTGKIEWFERINDECSICCAPGFTCEDTRNCKYAPDNVVVFQPTLKR